ncbi:hypothetical protein EYZ11_010912 [Aspergillus tanneri]|uniref:Uncharacterized protein n=1 Tax=Aspergillus tanneri TaxID=1220188 RepID=A0A4S3J438_9EURO|nr:hypothetical protein EYZ11_010912 [Aspergillus tanneri]
MPCCVVGDYCLSDNICSYTHTLIGGSGYYSAGCSANAEDFGDTENVSVCAERCAGTRYPDIVYDTDNDIWKCCSAGKEPNCQAPSNESFSALAPSDLQTYWFAGMTTSIPSSTATSATGDTISCYIFSSNRS